MSQNSHRGDNRFQKAVEVLQKGREVLMRDLADEILYHAEDFTEGGFLFQEFLENQGTKLHFLYLMLSQLEQSSDAFEEARSRAEKPAPPQQPRSRRRREPEESDGELQPCPVTKINLMGLDSEPEAPPKKPKAKQRKRRKIQAESSVPSPRDDAE